jgi:hypothetical protein
MEKELENFKGFLEEAARWQKVNLLRSYVEGVELRAIKNNSLSEKMTAWLKWAREKLDWDDPAVNKEDELSGDVDRERLRIIK